MSVTRFRVESIQSLELAECASVPPVMIIAGPNGVGKSTLLYALKRGIGVDNQTRTFYHGPHRVLRRTTVERRYIKGGSTLLSNLEGDTVTPYDGLNLGNTSRNPNNVDEAASTIKYILANIESRRQQILTTTVDRLHREKKTMNDIVPDIYDPIRKLTQYLLPQLRFDSIVISDNAVHCQWERTDSGGTMLVDLDDLSSGEKSIIILFLPLIENQIDKELNRLVDFGKDNVDVVVPVIEDRLMLIDEPEQHLHPDLQAKILGYIRTVTRETPTQFIITTHSPTILDQAFEDELYVLSPRSATGANQLQKIATSVERLEALKQLAGSTYFLTTGRVIVCIEGERNADPNKPTDARLLEILYPRAAAFTLIPTTGKGNVITTVERLRENVPEDVFRIRIRGLVDADQTTTTVVGIETLPVCMIENLLLEPLSIFEFLATIGITTFENSDMVDAELRTIALAQREEEIALRLGRKIKSKTIRIKGSTIEEIHANYASQVEDLSKIMPDEDSLKKLVEAATSSVDQLIRSGDELNQFRGKNILTMFHHRHIAPYNIGYNSFCIQIAKIIATKNIAVAKLDPVFDRLLGEV